MLEEFAYLGKEKAYEVVVTNTQAVADQVETFPLLPEDLFPPRLENSEEELNSLVWNKVHALYGENPPQLIVDRLNVELGGILGKYDVVYMSAQKLVQRSLENGYLVGSRGSVGSSLVAYMSGITEVNSLPPHYRCPSCKNTEFIQDGSYGCGADMPDKVCPVCGTKYIKDGFDIPFETFLGFGGGKVPDIDLNFSGEYQARAHRHAIEMFGETQVFRAGTIGTLAEKTAYGFVKKYLEENGMTVGRAEENRLTLGCVGTRRTTGQHPGGLVVVPDDMDMEDFCPVQHPADADDSDTVTTHFEYHSMEANLLKLDMLGHDDPTMVRMMQDLTGVDPHDIPLDDPDTMSIFTSSKVLGYENDEILGPTGAVAIPEFNTRFTRQMLVDTQPKDFNTLVRLSGFSHGTDVWLGNARDLIVSGTASVLETVGCRDDIMLYLISKGLDPKMSFKIMEKVRKGKVKKGGFDEGWVEAMRDHDVPEWYIESLAKIGYLFPKAHAVAYVMMAFRIAWYKVHEPLAFYATFFSVRAKAFDAEYCCAGKEAVKRKIREIENNKDATAVEQNLLTTLEVCYEFYLRGFHFDTISIYESDATRVQGDRERPAAALHHRPRPGRGGGHRHGGEAEGEAVRLHRGVRHVLQQAVQDPHRAAEGAGGLRRHGGDQPADAVLIPAPAETRWGASPLDTPLREQTPRGRRPAAHGFPPWHCHRNEEGGPIPGPPSCDSWEKDHFFSSLPLHLAKNFSFLMIARVWVPLPMGPASSQAFTAKSTILPFSDTPVISASAHTFIPMGVGAS